MRRILPFLLGGVAAAAVFVGGVVLGDARTAHRDAIPPETSGTAEVAVPVATQGGAPEEPADAAATRPPTSARQVVRTATETDLARLEAQAFDPDTGIGTAEPIVPNPPTADAAAGTTTTEAPDASTSTTGSETTTGAAPAAPTAPLLDLDPSLLDDLHDAVSYLRFLDPCADADTDGCPDGVGGTILMPVDEEGTPPEPLAIGRQIYTYIAVQDLARCPLGVDDAGVLHAMIASNNPMPQLDLDVRLGDESLQQQTVHSSEEERSLWFQRRLRGEGTYAQPGGGVLTCFSLRGLPAGRYLVRFSGTDDLGSTASADTSLVLHDDLLGSPLSLPGGRPPISLTGFADHGRLSVPIDHAHETAYVGVLPRNGDAATGDSCTDIENDVLSSHRRSYSGLIYEGEVPIARTPGSPAYDERYDEASTYDLMAGEGAQLDVCLWIATRAPRSFDLPTVVLRRTLTVQAPRYRRSKVSVVAAHLDDPLAPRDLQVRADGWHVGGATRFPDTDLPVGVHTFDEPIPLLDSGDAPHPSTTRIEITGPAGRTLAVDVPTPKGCGLGLFGSACPDARHTYVVGIPGPGYEPRLCGSVFGSGCGDPEPGTYAGTLTIAVESYAGPAGPPDATEVTLPFWQTEDAGSFQHADAPEPPAFPQLDRYGSYARARRLTGEARPTIDVRLAFDRAVTVDLQAEGWTEDSECGGAPQHSALGITHFFQFDALCFGRAYSFDLLATAADGTTIDWRTVVDGEPSGRAGWGYEVTPGLPIDSWDYDLTFDLTEPVEIWSATFELDGYDIPLVAAPSTGCRNPSFPLRSRAAGIVNEGGYPILFSEPLAARVHLTGRRCDADGHPTGERFDVTNEASIDLADLFAGPLTVHGSSELGGMTLDLTVRPGPGPEILGG